MCAADSSCLANQANTFIIEVDGIIQKNGVDIKFDLIMFFEILIQ